MTENETASPGLYIHIPFCRTKCPYCDFYSIPSPDLAPAYLEALELETCFYRGHFQVFDTLYLGGGTPSLLARAQIADLMKNLRRHFDFAPDAEITLEANPDDVTPEKLALWRALGFNRLSLGVQSFDEEELVFLGRRHAARQSAAALESIRAAGFANLGIDLIYGLPGQRAEDWLATLEKALSFRPEHLSCYQLTVDEDTALGRLVAAGQVQPLEEETQRDFFLLTSRFLQDRGYLHYEVSNFAREERSCSRHNYKYWRHTPYLGLGPGAHSFSQGHRWWNHRSLKLYVAALAQGEAPVAGDETLTPEQLRLETLYLGFRTREGVSLDTIRQLPEGETILAELESSGLLQVVSGRVIATSRGLVVADRLPLWFI